MRLVLDASDNVLISCEKKYFDELFVNSLVIRGNVDTCDAKYANVVRLFHDPGESPIIPIFPLIAWFPNRNPLVILSRYKCIPLTIVA